MKQFLLILPFITQWSFFDNGNLVLSTDETELDSVTVDMRTMDDMSFSITLDENSMTITPTDMDRTYVWQLADNRSIRAMAQWVGRDEMTAEEFWQYYINLFFDPVYDLDSGITELNYKERAISLGKYTVIIAGCDSLGHRTSRFTSRRLIIPPADKSTVPADEPAKADTTYHFEFWKDGRIIKEMPSTAFDSITVKEVAEILTREQAHTLKKE